MEIKSIWNRHKWLSWIFPLHLNNYAMGLRSLEIFYFYSAGTDFRRQILTTKVDPRTVSVNSTKESIILEMSQSLDLKNSMVKSAKISRNMSRGTWLISGDLFFNIYMFSTYIV